MPVASMAMRVQPSAANHSDNAIRSSVVVLNIRTARFYRSPHRVADTVQDRVLANIQTGVMRIQIQSGMLKASGSD
jgi:hypothetical protein